MPTLKITTDGTNDQVFVDDQPIGLIQSIRLSRDLQTNHPMEIDIYFENLFLQADASKEIRDQLQNYIDLLLSVPGVFVHFIDNSSIKHQVHETCSKTTSLYDGIPNHIPMNKSRDRI